MTWSEFSVHRDDGVRLNCRDWGGGPGRMVILLHGLAGHAGEWDATARRLRDRGHRVVAPDLRGHGGSDHHPADVSRAAHVADVAALVRHLDATDSAVLTGQSLGGHTAMLTAAAHPDLVHALVMVEAAPGGPNPSAPADMAAWLDSWPLPFPSPEAAAAFLGEGWAAGLEQRPSNESHGGGDGGGWWPRFDRDAMIDTLAENALRDFWPDWARVRCPTLAVLAQSGIIPPAEAREMLRRRPDTTAVSIPGTGHDLHLERPEALHQALAAFLDQ